MTPDQWDFLNAEIAALKLFVACMAHASPDQESLRASIREQKEVLNIALLHSPLSDKAIELKKRKVEEMEKAVWG